MEATNKTSEKSVRSFSMRVWWPASKEPDSEANSAGPLGCTHTGTQVQTEPTDGVLADMVLAYANAAGDIARLGLD